MLTVEIKQINFTDTVHALASAACRHAEQRDGQIAARLYQLAADINQIGKDIDSAGLTDILNSQLPSAVSAIEAATGQQRILAILKENPEGLTSEAIAWHLELAESTTRDQLKQLINVGKIQRIGSAAPYTYTLITEGTDSAIRQHYAQLYRSQAAQHGMPIQSQNTTPPPPPGASQRQQIIHHIEHNPGATAVETAHALGLPSTTVTAVCSQLKQRNQLRSQGSRPMRFFPIHPTPPTVQVPIVAPATTP